MIQTIELIYIIFCIWLADNNRDRIKIDKTIYHWKQACIHVGFGVVMSFCFNWLMLPLILLSARIFFTSALNLFRGFKLMYVDPTPEAWVDRIEQKVFGKRGEVVFMLYLFLWLIVNTLIINL